MHEFLPLLDHVTQRGPSRWKSRCPAHDDREPSLSITSGDKAILLRCFSGCDVSSICRALEIRTKELFYTETDPATRREAARAREARLKEQERDALKMGRLIDCRKLAERYLNDRRPCDISSWSDEKLNDELNLVCNAMHLLAGDPYVAN